MKQAISAYQEHRAKELNRKRSTSQKKRPKTAFVQRRPYSESLARSESSLSTSSISLLLPTKPNGSYINYKNAHRPGSAQKLRRTKTDVATIKQVKERPLRVKSAAPKGNANTINRVGTKSSSTHSLSARDDVRDIDNGIINAVGVANGIIG